MSDNPNQPAHDRKLISLKEDYAVRDWYKGLQCAPEQRRADVKAFGNLAAAVHEHLGKT